jgi:protein O-mannosyl-transferase
MKPRNGEQRFARRRGKSPAPVKPSISPPPSPWQWRNHTRDFIIGIILMVAVLAAYWPLHEYGFVNYDDPAYVIDNPKVRAGVTWESVRWAFTTFHSCNWHPLTWISLMLDVSLFGVNPGGHHIVNLIFHLLSTFLLFAVFRIMGAAGWPSAFVAALFALHPLHVESVAWISERKDVLSTFFWMLTMTFYALNVRRPGRRRYLLVIVSFALGLLSKPMLVSLPFVLLLLDFWPLGRIDASAGLRNTAIDLRRCFIEKIPLFALAVLSSIVTLTAQSSGGAVVPFDVIAFSDRLANALTAYVTYLLMTVWPAKLAIYYPHARGAIPFMQPFISTLVLLIITAVAVRSRRRFPYLMVGWLWYLVTLVPVIGIVQVGDQALADRYTYVPLIGVFIMIVWFVKDLHLQQRIHRIAVAAIGMGILSALTYSTHLQVQTWRNTLSLFSHALEVTTGNSRAHKALCVALTDEYKRYDEAADHCRKAIALDPNDADLYYSLGNALLAGGKTDDAVVDYLKAIRINPAYVNAHYNLGNALAGLQKYKDAIASWIEVLRLQPGHPGATNNIGSAYSIMGKYEDAIQFYEKALSQNPNNLEVWCNIGLTYGKMGNTQKAVNAYEQALRIDPDCTRAHEALKNLGPGK